MRKKKFVVSICGKQKSVCLDDVCSQVFEEELSMESN